MANTEHLGILQQGVDAWNAWRKTEPSIKPILHKARLNKANLNNANLNATNFVGAELRGAKLSGADLRHSYLQGAHLEHADLTGANLANADFAGEALGGETFGDDEFSSATLYYAKLSEANIFEANLVEVDLRGADLSRADLRGAVLIGADLRRANLTGAKLSGASLSQANLINACLDHADLTDAILWETQRGGWSIKDIICQRAFWDGRREEPTEYTEGEFERIFAERPRIVLRYPGGMSPVDLLALPLIVERLQTDYPDSVLQVRSVQNDAGGASVTITVEDLAGRSAEVFKLQLMQMQTKLESAFEERDHLRRLVRDTLIQISAQPRQEIHYHRPRGRIEGPSMSRDTYNIPGQAGAVGPGARGKGNTFQQIQSGTDLPKLAEELARLRAAMKGETTGTREQDKAIGAVADAEEAAAKGDDSAALRYLKGAGTWAVGIAEKIGVGVAIEALKRVG
jgi:uncharacterized protein YjbI with pentapeptide repeats